MKTFYAKLTTNLGDHGNHGTKRLLSIGVIHYHLLTKVTEKLAAKQNIKTWCMSDADRRVRCTLYVNHKPTGEARILPEQTTCVSDDQLDSFAVAEFSHMLLLIQGGVRQHHHLVVKRDTDKTFFFFSLCLSVILVI